jgi:hypothetical protein
MINWEQELNNLQLSTIADHMSVEGNPSLIGSDAPPGFFTGKDIRETGYNICALCQWIEDNSPFACDLVYRFETTNSKATIEFYWKDQLNEAGDDWLLAKSFGPFIVTGRDTLTGAFAGQHENLGMKTFLKVAEWIQGIINSQN